MKLKSCKSGITSGRRVFIATFSSRAHQCGSGKGKGKPAVGGESKNSTFVGKKSPWRPQTPAVAPSSSSCVLPCPSSTPGSHQGRISWVPFQRFVCIKDKLSTIAPSNGLRPLSPVINVCNLDLWLKPRLEKGQSCGGGDCHHKV